MSDDVRYKIGEEIARGDFATVYRGRDLRLQRDVAIKQLHQQYLGNPQLTERYWQEAQILARLEHPHVMTIYDVVPERGWLILELMKGSLKDQLGNRPIHLKDLRLTILFVARALAFFHQQDIVHGDVKPSNLLIDRNNVIKLGDFGIARRLQSDDGSAIKGTTRYIAPEVVSDKFGPVGPHSDIYSLGFSAYELLCGERFESLFPGLHMFGRDQQLAWMMWHSAPDRRLPKIRDVLEGVPEQLSTVIEKMTDKDPARRYHSAEQIIADLSSEQNAAYQTSSKEEDEEAALQAKRAKRKRWLTIGACGFSLLLSLAMLIPRNADPQPVSPPSPTQGLVGKVAPDRQRIYLKSDEILAVEPGDLILLDGAECSLAELAPNDRLSIQYHETPDGRTKLIRATRAEARSCVGRIVGVDRVARQLLVSRDDQPDRQFSFDGQTTVTLNGKSAVVTDLQKGDSIEVRFSSDADQSRAVSLLAKRLLATQGTVNSYDTASRRITFLRDGKEEVSLPVSPRCKITINGRDDLAGREITISDIQGGDTIVQLAYDAEVLSLELTRSLSDLAEVWSIAPAEQMMTVVWEGERVDVSTSDATLRYRDRDVDLGFLRRGDRVGFDHDSPDHRDVHATSIEVAELVRDPQTVAIVIYQQNYDSVQITPYKYAERDGLLVRDALDTGARIPENQLLLLANQTHSQLSQSIVEFLDLQPGREQLIVFVVGQAYVDLKSNETYLATRDFRLANMAQSGLALRELIAIMEEFEAREKLLILDTCHDVSVVEQPSHPATGDQIRMVQVGDAVSRSVTVIGSCDAVRQNATDDEQQLGELSLRLAQALTGQADEDGNRRVSADELYRYLQQSLAKVDQTPVRFLPDARPPRLNPEAVAAVEKLLAELSRRRASDSLDNDYQTAARLSEGQPDADIAYGLIKLHLGRTGESLDIFRAILGTHPDALVAYHAAAYQHLAKKEWNAAADMLGDMLVQLNRLPPAKDEYVDHLLHFAGVAQGFIGANYPNAVNLKAVEKAALQLSPERKEVFASAQREFAKQYEETPSGQQGSIRHFYRFDVDRVKQYLADALH